MVAKTTDTVMSYEERVPVVPKLSHGRRVLLSDGGPNRLFPIYLITDHSMAIEFPNTLYILLQSRSIQ
jgi:hypothetical protein